jgi:hypothetical protein
MWSADVRKKVSDSHKASGCRPVQQGGNGRGLTEPQAAILSWFPFMVAEYPVTWGVYKDGRAAYSVLDLADVDLRINIEADGASHRTLKARKRDLARDARLARVGWRVYRVSNEDVQLHPDQTRAAIIAYFPSLLKKRTAISRTVY